MTGPQKTYLKHQTSGGMTGRLGFRHGQIFPPQKKHENRSPAPRLRKIERLQGRFRVSECFLFGTTTPPREKKQPGFLGGWLKIIYSLG